MNPEFQLPDEVLLRQYRNYVIRDVFSLAFSMFVLGATPPSFIGFVFLLIALMCLRDLQVDANKWLALRAKLNQPRT